MALKSALFMGGGGGGFLALEGGGGGGPFFPTAPPLQPVTEVVLLWEVVGLIERSLQLRSGLALLAVDASDGSPKRSLWAVLVRLAGRSWPRS